MKTAFERRCVCCGTERVLTNGNRFITLLAAFVLGYLVMSGVVVTLSLVRTL